MPAVITVKSWFRDFTGSNSMEGCWLVIMGPFTRAWVGFEPGSTLKGNRHELRMHLRRVVCDNMPGFLATFRLRNLLFCLELSLSPSYAGGFALHRCRRESNLKSSGSLFQINFSWQFPINTCGYLHETKLYQLGSDLHNPGWKYFAVLAKLWYQIYHGGIYYARMTF